MSGKRWHLLRPLTNEAQQASLQGQPQVSSAERGPTLRARQNARVRLHASRQEYRRAAVRVRDRHRRFDDPPVRRPLREVTGYLDLPPDFRRVDAPVRNVRGGRLRRHGQCAERLFGEPGSPVYRVRRSPARHHVLDDRGAPGLGQSIRDRGHRDRGQDDEQPEALRVMPTTPTTIRDPLPFMFVGMDRWARG